jgi:hypothetical protein
MVSEQLGKLRRDWMIIGNRLNRNLVARLIDR